MSTRQVVTTKGKTFDNEDLVTVCIFEENVSKEAIKKMNRCCKTYKVLVFDERNHAYEWKEA